MNNLFVCDHIAKIDSSKSVKKAMKQWRIDNGQLLFPT